MTKLWVLTEDSFNRLLTWLDPNRDEAGRKYESIRQSLIKIFSWRGYSDAEDLADETINRVTQRVPELAETYVGDPALYFYGVAKKVLLERQRKDPLVPASMPNEVRKTPVGGGETDDDEAEYECLERCLQKLSPQDRQLILLYYSENKQAKITFRRSLAQRLGIETNNLRVKVHRIRAALHACIEDCLDGEGSS